MKMLSLLRYEDADGWCGVSVSSHYLTDCLLQEYRQQEPAINLLLQGTFRQAFKSDHTRKIARKVTLSSGAMSSYALMNENWMILSWVMGQSEAERSLEPMYEGLANRYTAAGVDLAKYHWVDRDCCAAFRVLDPHPGEHQLWAAWKTTEAVLAEVTAGGHVKHLCLKEDLQRLKDDYATVALCLQTAHLGPLQDQDPSSSGAGEEN
ncbi:uncharacterized protein FYW47_006245 [Aplochiton taeniatus]